MFLLLAGKCELKYIINFFVWDWLSRPECREVIEVINYIIYVSDEPSYTVVLGVKQSPIYVYLLVL